MNGEDIKFMKLALKMAKKAASLDEIPVGAVLVRDGIVRQKAFNLTKSNKLKHAEKIVLENELLQGEKLLHDYTLYSTLEPCCMCAGIIILSRVGRVVYGCADPKGGAVNSVYTILSDGKLNHSPKLTKGVLREESSKLLKTFFKKKRIL